MRHVAIISPFDLPLVVALAKGVSEFGRRRGGWDVEVVSAVPRDDVVQRLSGAGVEGLIGLPRNPAEAASLQASRLPAVGALYHTPLRLAGGGCRDGDELDPAAMHAMLPVVLPDERAVGQLAARHLLDRGYKQFVCLSTRWRVGRLRQVGFGEELRRAACTCLTLGDARQPRDAGGLPELVTDADALALLRQARPPMGVFTVDDRTGLVTQKAAAAIGLRVPQDVAIVGVNNDELLVEFARTPLSSVDLNVAKIGRVAASMLESLIEEGSTTAPPAGAARVRTVPPVGVIERRSTQMLVVEEEAVQQALTLMQRRACQGLTVGALCESMAISRRSLERKMIRALNRTPAEEIRRVRIERARDLLRRPDVALADVAQAVGYGSQSSFSAAFTQVCGITPGRWRRAQSIAKP